MLNDKDMKKGVVIDLMEARDRINSLRSAYATIAECSEQLRNIAVELALKGVWKEWSDSKPVGTEYSFTYEEMHQTGDSEIDAIVDVVDTLEEYLECHACHKTAGREERAMRVESSVMSREEWQDRFWPLSDNEWHNLVQHDLVPGSGSAQWLRFEELLSSRQPTNENSSSLAFSEEEILFLGKMDLVRFGEKFPAEAEHYMELTE